MDKTVIGKGVGRADLVRKGKMMVTILDKELV
jgi:hypothetical protein